MKDRDTYVKFVQWSDEDQCYVGLCPELFYGGVHGDDEAKVYADLCNRVDEIIELRKDDNTLPEPQKREMSGVFTFRVGKELHQSLFMKSVMEGKSINELAKKAVEKGLQAV